MKNKRDEKNFWYELNLALAGNSHERRRTKREWDKNLFNSKVVSTLHTIALSAGIALGTYQAYQNKVTEKPSSIYKGVENGRSYNCLDDMLTIIP